MAKQKKETVVEPEPQAPSKPGPPKAWDPAPPAGPAPVGGAARVPPKRTPENTHRR